MPYRIASAIAALSLCACATIVGNPVQLVPVRSTPSDALVVITDETGREVFKGQTPTAVTLAKSNDTYWGKKSYQVSISKAGFRTQTIPITASANGWYILGNVVFGGLIGWFIVDPLNGNMYTLSPEVIENTLAAEGVSSHNNPGRDHIAIMLVADVPETLRDKMQRIQ